MAEVLAKFQFIFNVKQKISVGKKMHTASILCREAMLFIKSWLASCRKFGQKVKSEHVS